MLTIKLSQHLLLLLTTGASALRAPIIPCHYVTARTLAHPTHPPIFIPTPPTHLSSSPPHPPMRPTAGHRPATDFLEGQLELNKHGYVVTPPGSTATSVPGELAAGS